LLIGIGEEKRLFDLTTPLLPYDFYAHHPSL
jgi:hypothetical protein